MKGHWSLRGQLSVVLGGLALAILGSVGGYLGSLATDELFAAQQAVVRSTAQSAAELLASQLRDREREIELLSLSPHLMQGPSIPPPCAIPSTGGPPCMTSSPGSA